MTGEDSPFRKRKLQHVVDKTIKVKVVKWIVETNESEGPKGLKAEAEKAFPGAFRGNTNANLAKASDWWKKTDLILNADLCKFQIHYTFPAGSAGDNLH